MWDACPCLSPQLSSFMIAYFKIRTACTALWVTTSPHWNQSGVCTKKTEQHLNWLLFVPIEEEAVQNSRVCLSSSIVITIARISVWSVWNMSLNINISILRNQTHHAWTKNICKLVDQKIVEIQNKEKTKLRINESASLTLCNWDFPLVPEVTVWAIRFSFSIIFCKYLCIFAHNSKLVQCGVIRGGVVQWYTSSTILLRFPSHAHGQYPTLHTGSWPAQWYR